MPYVPCVTATLTTKNMKLPFGYEIIFRKRVSYVIRDCTISSNASELWYVMNNGKVAKVSKHG